MNRDESGRLWVVAVAEHKREAVANMNLLARGYSTFWIHYSAISRRKDQFYGMAVIRPYYPGYIFVAVDDVIEIAPIGRTRGVDGLLWDIDDQHYLPTKWLAQMREECLNNDGLHDPPDDGPPERGRFHSGDRVKCRGLWERFETIVLKDVGKLIEVEHIEGGRRVVGRYDPIQVERA